MIPKRARIVRLKITDCQIAVSKTRVEFSGVKTGSLWFCLFKRFFGVC